MNKIQIPERDLSNKPLYYTLDPNTHEVKRFMGDLLDWMTATNGGIIKIKDDYIVKDDYIDDVHVSTVFLGLDHSFGNSENPILFETMIFGGGPDYNEYQERYSTYQEAYDNHLIIVEQVINKLPIKRKTLKMKF